MYNWLILEITFRKEEKGIKKIILEGSDLVIWKQSTRENAPTTRNNLTDKLNWHSRARLRIQVQDGGVGRSKAHLLALISKLQRTKHSHL